MRRRRGSGTRRLAVLAVLVAVGCAGPATTVPVATEPATPTSTNEPVASHASPASASPVAASPSAPAEIELVALGDSIPFNLQADCPGCTGYVAQYGKAIAQATGKTVGVHNLSKHTGLTSDGLLADLKTDEGLRKGVAEADVITVSIGINDAPMTVSNDSCDGASGDLPILEKYTDACIDEWADGFAERFDQILSEIEGLRSGRPTLLTVVSIYDWWLGWSGNSKTVDENIAVVRTVLERQNRDICRIAAEHQGLCADLHAAFNGPKHDRPSGALLGEDHAHPSQQGNDLIADTLTKLGFGPLQ